MMLMALIQLSRMLGGIFREPIWGLVSHPVCQPRCFRAPSMWQQAGVRLAGRLAGQWDSDSGLWQGVQPWGSGRDEGTWRLWRQTPWLVNNRTKKISGCLARNERMRSIRCVVSLLLFFFKWWHNEDGFEKALGKISSAAVFMILPFHLFTQTNWSLEREKNPSQPQVALSKTHQSLAIRPGISLRGRVRSVALIKGRTF